MEIRDLIGLGGIPLILACVQASKCWVDDERYYPFMALAWGLTLNLLAALALQTDLATGALFGVLAGLSASGLYSVQDKARQRYPKAPPPHG